MSDSQEARRQEWLAAMSDDEKQRIRAWLASSTALSAEELAAMDAEELHTTHTAALRARLETHI